MAHCWHVLHVLCWERPMKDPIIVLTMSFVWWGVFNLEYIFFIHIFSCVLHYWNIRNSMRPNTWWFLFVQVIFFRSFNAIYFYLYLKSCIINDIQYTLWCHILVFIGIIYRVLCSSCSIFVIVLCLNRLSLLYSILHRQT